MRLLLFLLVVNTATLALAAESSPTPSPYAWEDKVWRPASELLVDDALRKLPPSRSADGAAERRRIDYTRALLLLNAQPKLQRNIDQSRDLLESVRRVQADDEPGLSALYYLARIAQFHTDPSDPARAAALYTELIGRAPGHPLAQEAVSKLAAIRLFEEITPEERRARVAGFETAATRLQSPAARRDLHFVLAEALLRLNDDRESALRHLLAAEEAGILRQQLAADTMARVAVLARELGHRDIAIAHYKKFLTTFQRDNRAYMLAEQLRSLETETPPAPTPTQGSPRRQPTAFAMNPARREKILNLIGLGLLACCFVLSLGRIIGRYARHEDADGKTTIRFAHWQLESGLREAYDRLAAEYMRLHPDVIVEQMPVPETVFPNWLRTQLIGGTAPEVIEIGGRGDTNEILATYFEPVTPYLERPNPYNKDNDLARTPWRDTFIDGLSHAYNQELLQYYTIPNSMFTVRMFYNRPLWREIFGSEVQPRTYEELVDDCRRAAAYHTSAGQPILPLAGSQNNAPFLIQRLFSSQTQRLFYSLARPGSLYATNEQLALDFLTGKWTFDTPAVRDGLELARGVGQYLPPGFLQLRREDALFIFSQGRALMTVTGSWDAPSLRSQAAFEVGVFDVPVPAGDDPRYGRNTMGTVSEAGAATGLTFAMTKQTSAAKQAQVVDFLHFMTSRDANRKFSDDSGWLPAVVGVQPLPEIRPFLPHAEGYPAGFSMGISLGDNGGSFGTETGRVEDTNMYRLFEPDGGPGAYVQEIANSIRPALVRDFNTIQRVQLEVITRQETTLAAFRELKSGDATANAGRGDTDELAAKVSELEELQTQEEIGVAMRRWNLKQLGITLEK